MADGEASQPGSFGPVKQEETLVLAVTDVHYGKGTPTFDPDVCRQRMSTVVNRVARIIDLLGHGYDFDKIVVLLLGDINDGTDIYRTQTHHQALTNVEQQAEECARTVLVPFLTDLAVLLPVEVVSVTGNHGRAGWRAHEGASWDTVAYRYTALRLQNHKRITFEVAPVPASIQVVNVRGHGILAYHGHEIRMYQTIPWYGLMQRFLRWNATRDIPDFAVAHVGHFHSFGRWNINNLTIMQNGTMVTGDDWALQTLGMESANQWWLHGTSNSRPVTFAFGVDLCDAEADEPQYFARSAFLYPSRQTQPRSKRNAAEVMERTAKRGKQALEA